MSVRFVTHIEAEVFEKNMLQGGYLDVNRRSANGTRWNSEIGNFMNSKLPNSLRVMVKKYRSDDATNVHGRGKDRNFGRKYSKEKFHSEDIFSERRIQTQHTVENWS